LTGSRLHLKTVRLLNGCIDHCGCAEQTA
jgi:hypothetical protein